MIYINKDYYFDNLEWLDLNKIEELISVYGREKMMRERVKSYFSNFE
jgi:hypothetical protein